MKKLLSKIKIHPLTYILLLIIFLEGLFKYACMILLIIVVHEMGHLFFMRLFKRKVKSISMLPFGGVIKIDSFLSTNIYEDLLISIGGILFQLILFLITNNEIIIYYNKLIIIFNLLPICPLDGYKINKLFLEIIIPYKRTFYISIVISISLIFLIIILNISIIYSNILIFSFLLFSSLKEYKLIYYYMNRFYIERMNHIFKFNRSINIKKKDNMYKNRVNIINGELEHIYLRKRYLK